MLDRRQEIAPAEEGGEDKWMLSYGDMMTLLLTFFVLLFAMSTLDTRAFREMVISLKGTFGVLTGGERVFLPGDLPEPEPASGEPVASHALTQALPQQSESEAEETEAAIDIQEREGEIIVRIPTAALFDSGGYEIKQLGREKLATIAGLINAYENEVTVVGHADATQITPGSLISSNWHLSALRAAEVIKYFVNEHKMDDSRFSLAAYGHTLAVSPDDRKNRRVELIFRPLGGRSYPDRYKQEGVQ